MLVLAGGFVYAAGQHFASLRLGYETEKLRNALAQAREEQHRLTVQKEIAASPARLERAARQLGMQPMQPAQFDPLKQIEMHESKIPVVTKAAPRTSPIQKTQQPRGKPAER